MPKLQLLGVQGLLLLTACTTLPPSTEPSTPEAPVAVATTTQLGSVLGEITACAGTASATLMGPGDDPHDFSVSSSEVAALVNAKLVVANGLGLEAGLATMLRGAKTDGANVYEVAQHLAPLAYADIETAQASAHAGHAHADDEGLRQAQPTQAQPAAHGEYDPHVHMDVARMATAAELIGEELTRATAEGDYTTCGAEAATKLRATDAEVRQILAQVPEDKRVLVTDHEAYNYFADAYGFRIAGVVVPGGGTDAEPSSAELADLVAVIQEDNVSAIFSNNTVNPRLVEAVAREAGVQIDVVELFEGSLGPAGSGADTYQGMMLTNARRIADALKG